MSTPLRSNLDSWLAPPALLAVGTRQPDALCSRAMTDVLERLGSVYEVAWEFQDSAEARADIRRCLEPLLTECPALNREETYLEALRTTGGFEARDQRVSFGFFGFGMNVTSLLDGEPLERDHWFRFADLMLPEFEENLVFSFDLSGSDRAVYATPGSRCDYWRYADNVENLVERIVALSESVLCQPS